MAGLKEQMYKGWAMAVFEPRRQGWRSAMRGLRQRAARVQPKSKRSSAPGGLASASASARKKTHVFDASGVDQGPTRIKCSGCCGRVRERVCAQFVHGVGSGDVATAAHGKGVGLAHRGRAKVHCAAPAASISSRPRGPIKESAAWFFTLIQRNDGDRYLTTGKEQLPAFLPQPDRMHRPGLSLRYPSEI